MNNDFQNMLTSMLEEYENGGDVNTVIENSCKKYAVSQEVCDKIQQVNALLDAFAQKAESLQQTKEKGGNRRQWMEDEIERIVDGRSEEEKAMLLTEMSKIEEDSFENASESLVNKK